MVPVSLLFLRVHRGAIAPLTAQLIRQLRDAVLDGTLAPGDRLPSTRALSRRLAVSRNTVVAVYDALAADGTISVEPRKGPRVASVPRRASARSPQAAAAPELSRSARWLAAAIPESRLDGLMSRRPRSRPFGAGLPDLDLLPMRALERCLVRRLRAMSSSDALHDDPRGELSLRRAVLRHVASARGIRATTDQVFITEGSQGGIDLCCRTLLDSSRVAWIESPAPLALRSAVRFAGGRLVRVPVDEQGARVDIALRRAPDARVAFVSPAYSFPSGARLSLPRRLRLLDWASKGGATIVEIDYEGELQTDGAPVQSLLSLDVNGATDRVIHVGTFSRSLFPALRLGFLIVPRALVRPFAMVRAASTRSSPFPLQAALADFIEAGHWARHMRRLRLATRRRRDLVLDRLRRLLPKTIVPRAPAGGALLALQLPEHVDDVALASTLTTRGVEVLPMRDRPVRSSGPRGLVLGIGAHSDAALLRAAEVLAEAVREAIGSRSRGSS
jgi:GntR family transcriptional regulator / MocR family aminotransferase